MFTVLRKILRKKDGATAIEYGLIAALVALVMAVGATTLGTTLKQKFTDISTTIQGAGGGGAAPPAGG